MANKEQWDYIGKEYLPETEKTLMYRDVYGLWINPFTGKKKLIMLTDNSSSRRMKCTSTLK